MSGRIRASGTEGKERGIETPRKCSRIPVPPERACACSHHIPWARTRLHLFKKCGEERKRACGRDSMQMCKKAREETRSHTIQNRAPMQTLSHTLESLPMGPVRLDWGPVCTRVPFAAANMNFCFVFEGVIVLQPSVGAQAAVFWRSQEKREVESPTRPDFLFPTSCVSPMPNSRAQKKRRRRRERNETSRKQTSPYLR